MKAFVIKGLL